MFLYRFVFSSLDEDFLNNIKRELKAHPEVYEKIPEIVFEYRKDIKNISLFGPQYRFAFVCPIYSIASLKSEIEKIYDEHLFPNISNFITKCIIDIFNYKTSLDRFYFPIGNSLIVEPAIFSPVTYWTTNNAAVVVTSTSFLPHDVSTTRNAYHAFMASLCVIEKYNKKASSSKTIHTIVCPSICCGSGKMKPHESARQIICALNDFVVKNKRLNDISNYNDEILLNASDIEDIIMEQPDNFDNRELKNQPIFVL